MAFGDVAAIDVGNVVLAGGGLALVLGQLNKTLSAAEAASRAASKATGAIAQQITIADLGRIQSDLRGLQAALRGEEFAFALVSSRLVKDQIVALRARSGVEGVQTRLARLSRAASDLQRIREALERDRLSTEDASELDIADANGKIDRIIDLVVEWQESRMFSNPGGQGT